MSKTSNFAKADKIALGWIRHLDNSDGNRDIARLERLMLQALPEQWQSRAVSAGLQNGVWTLCVNNGSEAYQLRFLASEIESKLADKLPHPPKIKIRVDPAIWRQKHKATRPPATLYQRQYSDKEAEEILSQFMRNGLSTE